MIENVKVNNTNIGLKSRCFIIAEIGNNHNGNFQMAIKLIDESIKSGADAVKFQIKDVDTAFSENLLNSPYNNHNSFGSTYREHKKNLELSYEEYDKLKQYAENKNIIFFATPFESKSLKFLEKINVPLYKVASFHNQNEKFIKAISATNKFIIISTGMSSQDEVDNTFNLTKKYTDNFSLLHCISSYPVDDEDVNLLVIKNYINKYKGIIGYSGHERGINICASSVLIGSKIIEKHFTLDRTMKGTDHALSLEPNGFRFMVNRVRLLERAMGNPVRKLLDCELPARKKNR